MTIGGSLFLIAAGAILRFGINDSIDDVNLATIGLILIVVGAVGLAIGIWLTQRVSTAIDRGDPRVAADPRYRV